MNGELSTAVSLALHGSAWLAAGDAGVPPALTDQRSTVGSLRRLSFSLAAGAWRSTTSDEGLHSWLTTLRRNGSTRIWLDPSGGAQASAPAAAASANGTGCGLLATGRRSSRWQPVWRVGASEPVRRAGLGPAPRRPPRGEELGRVATRPRRGTPCPARAAHGGRALRLRAGRGVVGRALPPPLGRPPRRLGPTARAPATAGRRR